MTASGCRWPGCTSAERRPWCDEHYRALPGHIRVLIAQGHPDAEREAIAWIRVTFDAEAARGRWDPGKWERLVRSIRERDEARARRRADVDVQPKETDALP